MSKLRSPAALFSSTMGTRPDKLRFWPHRCLIDLDKVLGSIEENIFCGGGQYLMSFFLVFFDKDVKKKDLYFLCRDEEDCMTVFVCLID